MTGFKSNSRTFDLVAVATFAQEDDGKCARVIGDVLMAALRVVR